MYALTGVIAGQAGMHAPLAFGLASMIAGGVHFRLLWGLADANSKVRRVPSVSARALRFRA